MSLATLSPAQRRSHTALEQLTEQEFVQVMWQIELPPHDALPLGPRVAVHVELPVQLRLNESAHSPTQSVWLAQLIEQLPAPPPQVCAVNAQLAPELQVQLVPLHVGGGGVEDPPQAPKTVANKGTSNMRMRKHSTRIDAVLVRRRGAPVAHSQDRAAHRRDGCSSRWCHGHPLKARQDSPPDDGNWQIFPGDFRAIDGAPRLHVERIRRPSPWSGPRRDLPCPPGTGRA
jgi:hypothetical protein